jgi:hypothetical protein
MMKDVGGWFLKICVAFIISILFTKSVRFFISQVGFSLAGDTSAQLEISAFFSSLLCSLGVSIAMQGRKDRRDLINESTKQTKQTVSDTINESLSLALFGKLHPSLLGSQIIQSFRSLMLKANSGAEETGAIVAAFLEHKLLENSRQIDELFAGGVDLPVSDHVAMTEKLASQFGDYVQIQRKAFLVPNEWTSEWLSLVERLSATKTRSQYILVASSEMIESERAKIISMAKYLAKMKINFKVCELSKLTDACGADHGEGFTVEIFGSKVVKLVSTPEGKYRGGVKLKLSISSTTSRPELTSYWKAAVRHSTNFK